MVHREEGDGLQKQLTDHSLQYCCSMLLKDSKHRVDMLFNPRNPHRRTPQYHSFSQCQQHWLAPERQRQRQRQRESEGGGWGGWGLGIRDTGHRDGDLLFLRIMQARACGQKKPAQHGCGSLLFLRGRTSSLLLCELFAA